MKSAGLRAAALILSVMMAVAGWFGGLYASGNLHEVVAGEYYRAGQLPPARLRAAIDDLGIRSIVNLRGSNMGHDWYLAEIAAAHEDGIAHLDFRMSARQSISPERAAELLAILRAAPKPVLVHCDGGADRTGLATALYLAAETDAPLAEAARALSWRYGHLGLPTQQAWPMDQSWRQLGPLVRSQRALSASATAPN